MPLAPSLFPLVDLLMSFLYTAHLAEGLTSGSQSVRGYALAWSGAPRTDTGTMRAAIVLPRPTDHLRHHLAMLPGVQRVRREGSAGFSFEVEGASLFFEEARRLEDFLA